MSDRGLRQESAAAFGDGSQAMDVDLGYDDHEFVVAPTANRIARAKGAGQGLRDYLESLVAGVPPVLAVDLLKGVDVDEKGAKVAIIAANFVERVTETQFHKPAIWNLGK